MFYKVAIPSYNRSSVICEKTLNTLQRFNVSKELIYIFVIDTEYEEYCNSAIDYNIIVGEMGLINQRRFIESYFDEGELIVYCDDDITDFDFENKSFDEFIIEAFHTLITEGANIFSVYPVWNSFFREKQLYLTTDLRFIHGGFYGMINRNIEYSLPNDMKEDVERTLKCFIRDGKVIRFNQYGFKTLMYSSGGCGNFKSRLLLNEQSVDHLVTNYGEYGKRRIRKNGIHEFVLKRIPATESIQPIKQWKINPILFYHLEELLSTFTIPNVSESGYDSQGRSKNGRRDFPKHRATTFGYVKQKIGGKIDLSYYSKQRPDIYDELLKIGDQICPFKYTSIHINNNVVSPKHTDSKNLGVSLLVSIGDYTGGHINIETEDGVMKYDAKYAPIVFDGSKYTHWNDEIISGNKYSLIFFSIDLNKKIDL